MPNRGSGRFRSQTHWWGYDFDGEGIEPVCFRPLLKHLRLSHKKSAFLFDMRDDPELCDKVPILPLNATEKRILQLAWTMPQTLSSVSVNYASKRYGTGRRRFPIHPSQAEVNPPLILEHGAVAGKPSGWCNWSSDLHTICLQYLITSPSARHAKRG